jgi:hypothetical protein
MELPFLKDQEVYPSDDVLKNVLGTSYPAYQELIARITDTEFELEPEWRYYKDGKAWLCKVCNIKKTIFWLSVWDKCFKVAFYFTEKTKPGILELNIKEEIKESFKKSKPIGKLIPLTVEIHDKEQITDVLTVAGFKKNLK